MRIFKATSAPKSLRWDGDELVDAVGGFRRWTADGTARPGTWNPPHPFDRAAHSPSGRWTVVYEQRGGEALLLDGQDVVRQVPRAADRSSIDRAMAVAELPDGREVLVYAPGSVLEIEELVSGMSLASYYKRILGNHGSRISIAPDGRRLAAAGFGWIEDGIAPVYDVAAALANSCTLDYEGILPLAAVYGEVGSVCWLDGDRFAVATTAARRSPPGPDALGPRALGVWSFAEERWLHRGPAESPWGTLVACGGDRVLALYGHPRLVDATTGAVLAAWRDVAAPRDESPYGRGPEPVAALHPDGTRLALAIEDGIAVLDLPRP
ncbi:MULTISPECIES: hypothetical protein [unclassified Streptomyces]|uniref:hypothetical protein n=1 Tax=unclassified Streptomyces TaxID=2593676 RepID=UPI002257EC18|nr:MULTISPECIES: hypothetical protein [unclassified Streptomyces]MCX4528222.1 hypothetical protein [Streptomyces sp. NBC_01551]MCX4541178.1 hypothetical protein [Streptomyces sp. NBC_01565]